MVDHRGRGAGVRAGLRRAPVAGAVHQPAEQRHRPGHRLDQPRLRGGAADVGNHAALCRRHGRPLRLRPRDRARRRPSHARHGAHAACPQHLDADPADRRRRRRRRRDGGPGRAHVGGSFGQFAVVPVAQLLTGVLGWVGALSAVGAMALAAAPLAWLLRGRPEAAPAGQRAAPEKSMRAAVRDAMRDPSFIYLTTGFFVCGFHVAFIATHLPGVVASCQLPPEVAAWSLSLIGLFNIAGSFTARWAIGRWRMKSVLSLLYAARGLAGIAFLAAPKTTTTFIVFSVVIGVTYPAPGPPAVGPVV